MPLAVFLVARPEMLPLSLNDAFDSKLRGKRPVHQICGLQTATGDELLHGVFSVSYTAIFLRHQVDLEAQLDEGVVEPDSLPVVDPVIVSLEVDLERRA